MNCFFIIAVKFNFVNFVIGVSTKKKRQILFPPWHGVDHGLFASQAVALPLTCMVTSAIKVGLSFIFITFDVTKATRSR